MASSAAYQKEYYETHKQQLREKAREREKRKRILAKAFVSASTQAKAEPAPSPSNTEAVKLTALIVAYASPLVVLISTLFVLMEMTHVYAESWGMIGGALLALAMEGFTLLFSFAPGNGLIQMLGFRLVALFFAALSMYGMSANHYASGMTAYRSDQVTIASIADLESTIKRKQVQSDELSAKGWISAARKLDRQIDTLREKLDSLRSKVAHSTPSNAVASTTLFHILLRVGMTLGNILGAHLFAWSLRKIETSNTHIETPIPHIEISRGKVLKFKGAVQRAQHLAGESPACKGVAIHALANIA